MSGEISARNSVGDDFEPQSAGVNALNAVEDRSDAAAEFVVVAVAETLEIDFIEIEPGTDVVEDLRRGVAVGDESGEESGSFGFFEDGDRPFAGDQRLVVGAD